MTSAVFADASAVAKRYLDEPGMASVRVQAELVVSELSRVEVASAIWFKHRTGGLTADEARTLLDVFELEWFGSAEADPDFVLIALDSDILDTGAATVATHELRTGDAIQIASAVHARRTLPELTEFLCFDVRLRRAAASEGFALLPAEL